MARITVSIDIAAPLEEVWSHAADLPSHTEWMADAESISFEGHQTSGVGTRMRVETVVGPLRTTDVMEVTEWSEPHTIGVRHSGMVAGEGRFRLSRIAGGTRFTWTEELTFPPAMGGPVGAAAARPVLAWVWRRNLEGLKRRVEGA